MGTRLRDKVAVVTGAGRGIGRGIALLLAAEGAAVIVNDLGTAVDGTGQSSTPAEEVAAEIRAQGGRASANGDSVASFTAAEHLINTAVQEFGRIDILVNNAGILRDRMVFNLSEEDWDTVIAVHLKGAFNCTRHAAAHMRQQHGGRIINMSSTSGLYGNSGQANYGAAKDGIAGLTRVTSRDLGKYGITVNAIAPAAATRLAATVSDAARRIREERRVSVPGPIGQGLPQLHMHPDDVAPFAVYLATEAAGNINGQTFLVRGSLVSLLNYPAPVRTITKVGRWTPEEIAMLFPSTLGLDLPNPAPPKG
ncbi:MAG: SDR family NAD(P)-dependent oxidoreductase [Candidatus Binatia bacterium]